MFGMSHTLDIFSQDLHHINKEKDWMAKNQDYVSEF
jgi:hypothetical protein